MKQTSTRIDDIACVITYAPFILIAKLIKAVPGPVRPSRPPIRHIALYFDDFRWYRHNPASAQFDSSTKFKYLDRSEEGVHLNEGERYAVAGSYDQHGVPFLTELELADGEVTQLVMEMPSVPVGWVRQVGGGWVYPINVDCRPAWWSQVSTENSIRSRVTGRPALLCRNPKIEMSVKQVMDTNLVTPCGEFELSVTNTDQHDAITVPALLSDPATGKISWADSIIIVDVKTSMAYCPPGAGIEDHLVPHTLAPNTSVSTVINCLALKGEEHWRSSGSRLYLLFCLGEICCQSFFYYYVNPDEAKHEEAIGKPMFS